VKAFRSAFSTKFKDDYEYWQSHDVKKCDKIDALINDARTNPNPAEVSSKRIFIVSSKGGARSRRKLSDLLDPLWKGNKS
jgi:Txe/YoeB family toxin of Txe-Axe toxin-antitoxin module